MFESMSSIFGPPSPVKAKVVKWSGVPCLMASFRNSNPPQVWQMDLENLRSYSLKLVEKDGEWDIGYAVPDGVFKPVAHFDERHDAETAYEAVQQALIGGSVSGGGASGAGTSKLGRFFRVVLILFGIIFIVLLLRPSGPVRLSDNASSQNVQNAASNAPKVAPKLEIGVPMDADAILPRDVE